MSKIWGNKHECQSCGVRFYDLGKLSAVCPQCGTAVKIQVKSRIIATENQPSNPNTEKTQSKDSDKKTDDIDVLEDEDDDDEFKDVNESFPEEDG